MSDMNDFLEYAAKIVVFILGVVGLAKITTSNLSDRVKAIEEKDIRSVDDCLRLMESCPVHTHMVYIADSIKQRIDDEKDYRRSQTEWMRRMEDKIDRIGLQGCVK